MKHKLMLMWLALAWCATLFAQDDMQHFGMQIGFQRPLLREATAAEPKKLSNVTSMNGLRVGLVYDATLIKGFGVSLALNYNVASRYTAWQDGSGLTKYPQTRRQYVMQSIELPIDWQYKFEIAKQTYVIVYTGPAFEYLFTFKQNSYSRTYDQKVTRVSDSYFDYDTDLDSQCDYRQFNLKWSVGGGVQFQNYFIRAGYDFGIISPYNDRYNSLLDIERHGRFDGWNVRAGIYFMNF